MLDIRFIRENLDLVKRKVSEKGYDLNWDEFLNLDQGRRRLQVELDDLRRRRNELSRQVGILKTKGEDATEVKEEADSLSRKLKKLESEEREIISRIQLFLSRIPNLFHDSVPVGGAENNRVVKTWGDIREFDFKPRTHWEIASSLEIIDFPRAAKMSGSNFALFVGLGARLERSLYSFMLDMHTSKHGYKEVFPPFLVNSASMFGTGQLPNLEEDMYKLRDDDLFLIPTAEVPVTNMHRDEILKEEDLPIYYTAYSACFRREAGSYGQDTKGLLRVHQFDKVELVKFVLPEDSYDEHERLLADAEDVLQALGIPYRVVLLASGDLSFAAAKCYDIEIWSPGVGKWLEVSSCSNFEDFQARRANIRFKRKGAKKTEFVHTLNASGVALARLVAAILETYQTEDGRVIVPDVLRNYMGVEVIG